jgi:hypothetical protein
MRKPPFLSRFFPRRMPANPDPVDEPSSQEIADAKDKSPANATPPGDEIRQAPAATDTTVHPAEPPTVSVAAVQEATPTPERAASLARYRAEKDPDGWYVEDVRSGRTAEIHGYRLERLRESRAKSLADILNRREERSIPDPTAE